VQPFAGDLAGTPPIESQAFWQRPYRVPASSDPDTATAQTIGIMCQHVKQAVTDALVKQAATDALSRFGSLGKASSEANRPQQVATGAFWWCKLFVKFLHHEFIIREKLNEAGHLQGLISPEVLVRMSQPEGDCAIFSECVAAFLTVFGVPFEFVTVAVNPNEPEIFSHVYLYAVLPDGTRLPLDASHGTYPGWQVPSAHVSRRQVWDASGNQVPDRGSRFDGLHNYKVRGLGAMVFDDQTGTYYDDGTGAQPPYVAPTLPADVGSYFQVPASQTGSLYLDASTGAPYSGGAYVAPSQTSSQWAAFATSLAKMGFDLARINAIQPGTVVSANGAILRQNPGYAVGMPTGALNLGAGISTSTLMIGAVALMAILFMTGKR